MEMALCVVAAWIVALIVATWTPETPEDRRARRARAKEARRFQRV